MEHSGTYRRRRGARCSSTFAAVLALSGLFAIGVQSLSLQEAAAATHSDEDTGFPEPFSGTPEYEHVAPTQMSDTGQLNQPIGQHLADEIAREIGLKRADVLTEEQ